jgi:hypothetical protein
VFQVSKYGTEFLSQVGLGSRAREPKLVRSAYELVARTVGPSGIIVVDCEPLAWPSTLRVVNDGLVASQEMKIRRVEPVVGRADYAATESLWQVPQRR